MGGAAGTHEVLGILTAGLGLVEMATYSLAALALYRHGGFTLAEAAAGAALLPAMLIAFLRQLAHLTGLLGLIPVARLAVLAAAVVLVWRHHDRVIADGRALRRFARHHLLVAMVLLCTLGALGLAVVLNEGSSGHFVPPAGGEALPLPPAADTPLYGGFIALSGVNDPAFPGARFLPLMAYLSICFATYALARRYAWPPTAITVTLLVASMPRLVFLSVAGGVEIITAAASLLSLLFLYRAVERPDIKDCLLLAVALLFSASADRMGLAFPVLTCGLAVVVLHRRHGGRTWWELARAAPLRVAAAGLPLLIFAGGMFLTDRLGAGNGPSNAWVYNADGLLGATANCFRYGLQMLDWTPPVEHLLETVSGLDWNGFRLWVHDHFVATFFNTKGLASPFTPAMAGERNLAWFGPLAGLLFIPAVGWAWLRGPRRLKSLALALVAYLALMALIPAWMPGNVQYFTVFFVCAGFTVAFLLPPWRMTRLRRRFLQLSATALIVYAVGAVNGGM